MLHRRDAMLRLGQVGLGALTLPGLLEAAHASAEAERRGHARSCIYLFLWGGPPQMDLWDMKPDAPQGVRSLFQPISTRVPGITICDQMPRTAQVMDKVCVVRSVSHGSNTHEPSVYHMLTGRNDMQLLVPRNVRTRQNFPFFGSVVSQFSPPGGLPACVTVPRPIGHDGITYAGTHAGFLGPRHDPFEFSAAPSSREAPLHAFAPATDLSATRFIARKGLLSAMEAADQYLQMPRNGDALRGFYEQAFRMVSSPAAKRAFDLDLEPPAVRDRYGRNEYGESLLLARRLVEAGVRLVNVTWMYIFPAGRVANVWDNHAGYGIHGAVTGYDLLKGPTCIPPLDLAYSALLEDLDERGLLGETLVATVGEFGRTPKINSDRGRDHWGACQSALFAGGGIRGGQVYGASDRHAAFVTQNPVSPADFVATIYHAFGLSAEQEMRDRSNRPYRLAEGAPVTALF
jgi:hypothetical protein